MAISSSLSLFYSAQPSSFVYLAYWVSTYLFRHVYRLPIPTGPYFYLVGMRVLHVGDAVDMGGASTEEIAKIPVYQFRSSKPHAATPVVVAPARPSALEDIEMQSVPKKQPMTGKKQEQDASVGFWDRIWHQFGFEDNTQAQGPNEPEYTPIEIPNEQDQVCAICLSTYDDGDILCKLWYGFCFWIYMDTFTYGWGTDYETKGVATTFTKHACMSGWC